MTKGRGEKGARKICPRHEHNSLPEQGGGCFVLSRKQICHTEKVEPTRTAAGSRRMACSISGIASSGCPEKIRLLPRRKRAKAKLGSSDNATLISDSARSRSLSNEAAIAETHRASGSFVSFSRASRAYCLASSSELLGSSV